MFKKSFLDDAEKCQKYEKFSKIIINTKKLCNIYAENDI